MQPRLTLAALSLAAVLGLGSSVFAVPGSGGTGIVVPGKGNNGNNQKGQDEQTPPMRFYGAQDVVVYGKKHTMAIFTQVDGTGPIRTIIGDADPKNPEATANLETTVNKLTKGDVVELKLASWNNLLRIDYIKRIDVKPAEETPHGFIFHEFYNEPNSGAPIVRVTKYGQSYELTLQNVKSDKGEVQPDPELMDAVQKFKDGEAVYVQASPGRLPIISEIFPYTDPKEGKVTKVSQVAVEGGKTAEMEIQTDDGKTVTALVPGKVTNKHFVADYVLANQIRSMKPGTEVKYTARESDGKTYLVEIARMPKPTSTAKPASASGEMSNGGSRGG